MTSEWTVPVYHPRHIRLRVDAGSRWRDALRVTSDWSEFVSYGERVACEVLIVPVLNEWRRWPEFVEHQRTATATPRLMVTTPDPENLRRTCHVMLQDLVWLDPTCCLDLTDAIDRAAATGLLFRCTSILENATGLHEDLRNALVQSCHARPAVREVKQVAKLAHCGRSTLCNRWNECVGAAPAPRPKDLVDRIVLLRVIMRRHGGMVKSCGLG